MRRQGSGRDDAAMSQERQAPPEAGRAAEGPPPPPEPEGARPCRDWRRDSQLWAPEPWGDAFATFLDPLLSARPWVVHFIYHRPEGSLTL